MGEAHYRYGHDYTETAHLRDGTRVMFRCIRPEDKEMLREGFDSLSPESRYRRFMTSKNRLTDSELRYLTEVDGEDHFAIVAGVRHLLRPDEGMGVARFVRLAGQPLVAESAVTVLDAHQGRGLGTALLQRLMEAAYERGIRWFRAELLGENLAMRALLESMGSQTRKEFGGDGVVVVTVAVPPPPASPEELGPWFKRSALYRLLVSAAGELVSVEPRATLPPPPSDEG
jgi:GNAT superfamily N-acetyltransferase